MTRDKVLDNIENITDIGNCFTMSVTGYSMLPLLGHKGDKIVIRRTSPTEDISHRIAMFRNANRHIVVHRVVSIVNDIVTLQGDGNPKQRERCKRNEIIGIVERVIRRNGKEVDCTTRCWRLREQLWLTQPRFVRSYALAIIRRWLNFRN